jgi:hypothetical protein
MNLKYSAIIVFSNNFLSEVIFSLILIWEGFKIVSSIKFIENKYISIIIGSAVAPLIVAI